jgi:hypothetical protein
MNDLLRKIIYWGAVLSIYALLVVVVMRLLLAPYAEPPSALSADRSAPLEESSPQSLFDKVSSSGELSGVLLPLGPNEGLLPGDPGIWRDFKKVHQYDRTRSNTDGFDGLQAVADVSEFSRGAVSELFLSGAPRELFQRGHLLYLINDKNQLLVIDCADHSKPKLARILKHTAVKHMIMQGSVAYLLMQRPVSSAGMMIVVDLEKPGAPKELARVELPEDVSSLFFINSQLVVYTSERGHAGNSRVYLYDVDDYKRIRLRGSEEVPSLGRNFLQYGHYLLVPELSGGLSVYDFSEPLNPEQVAFLETPLLGRLAWYGSMVFATGVGGELFGVDLKDPRHPELLTVAEDLSHASFFLEFGNHSYFFTFNGYMQVFDLSIVDFSLPDKPASTLTGDLLVLPGRAALTPSGRNSVSLNESKPVLLPWSDSRTVVDHLVWQDSLVVLDDHGLLRFFRMEENDSLTLLQRMQLESPQRWLAADGRYLYAGGAVSLNVIVHNDGERASMAGQVALSGAESWDGIVLQKTLLLAAGKEGLLSYSLKQPEAPVNVSRWLAPRHVQGEVDVRHLAVAGTERVLFTAGRAGLFSGRIEAGGAFVMEGSFRFASSAHAIAVHGGLALVATEADVAVVDVREDHSFQNLGEIAFPAVEKIALAPPDLWAGYTASKGWSFLALPRLLQPGDKSLLNDNSQTPCARENSFRLNLFDDRVVKKVTKLVQLQDCQTARLATGGSLEY